MAVDEKVVKARRRKNHSNYWKHCSRCRSKALLPDRSVWISVTPLQLFIKSLIFLFWLSYDMRTKSFSFPSLASPRVTRLCCVAKRAHISHHHSLNHSHLILSDAFYLSPSLSPRSLSLRLRPGDVFRYVLCEVLQLIHVYCDIRRLMCNLDSC